MNQDLCTLCLKCIRSCPAEILKIKKSSSSNSRIIQVTDSHLCFECRACEVVCPVEAIEVFWTPEEQ
ncbi:4Fe-4S binding protein [Candidatus Hodarchaeum mangrovi]